MPSELHLEALEEFIRKKNFLSLQTVQLSFNRTTDMWGCVARRRCIYNSPIIFASLRLDQLKSYSHFPSTFMNEAPFREEANSLDLYVQGKGSML